MAKRQLDLAGWKVIIEDPDATNDNQLTPSRRSRRRAQSSELDNFKLQREDDGVQLQTGDCVMMSGTDTSIVIITSIQLGLKTYLELSGAVFLTKSFLQEDAIEGESIEKNEIFITPEIVSLKVKDIVDKVHVLNSTEFSQIVLDDSSLTLHYLCRRACNAHGERLSKEFDFTEFRQLLKRNYAEAVKFIAENTSVIISPKKAKLKSHSLKERLLSADSPSRKSYTESPSEDSDSDQFSNDSSDSDESESSDEETIEKEITSVKLESPTKKRQRSAPSTPRKKQTPSPRKRVAASRDSERKTLENVLSPLKKGFKVKTASGAGSLPSLSRGSSNVSSLSVDTSSEAFKELKAKLHTSTVIHSLPCREEEWIAVYTNVENAIQTQAGSCIYVSGTPGVGKTATIKEVIRGLQSSVAEGYLNDFKFLEINCLKLLSPVSAYEKLWEFISGIKVTPTNAALLLDDHFKKEDADRKPLVVLLDELDQIVTKTQAVMYNFFNWPTYANSKLIIIAVANTMDLPERLLTNKVSSRLGLRRIQFVGYTFEQLGMIISNRLTMISQEHRRKVKVSDDAVGFASRKVASVSGDARRALMICRRAVEIAEEEFLETATDLSVPESEQTFTIQIGHISKAINESVNSPIAQLLNLLSFEAKLILVGIVLRMRRSGLGEIPLGEVIDEMKNSLELLTSKDSSTALQKLQTHETLADFCYGLPRNIRMNEMARLMFQLEELGIIAQQNLRSERYRLVQLNISEDEVLSALKRDPLVVPML